MFKIPFLDLPPLQSAGGTVQLPGSKSISNRVLLLAGLAEGQTLVRDVLASDDTRVMLDALRALGCGVSEVPGTNGRSLQVRGLGGRLAVHEARLFLGNAGTAMRPLAAALAVLSAMQGGRFELSGVARMHERPIGDLVDALRQIGCTVDELGQPGYPPLRVSGVSGTSGTPGPSGQPLRLAAPVRVRGDVSSQFLTALLLALPLASAQQSITIEIVGELISKPYVEITLALLARFGIAVEREGWQRFVIPQHSVYRSPGEVHVEGDASSASYFIAAGALAATAQPVRIEGVGSASIQGDIQFVQAAEAMGAVVCLEANALEVQRGAWPLRAVQLDCNAIPDAAMTLAAMALYADGPTTLTHIASWRVKETDRLAAMACELRKFGAQVEEGPDWIRIHPPVRWQTAAIHTYDDHRMAMCASLAAFNPARLPLRVLDPQCVAKTFPDYFETLLSVTRPEPEGVPVIAIDGPTASGKGTLAAVVAERLGYHLLDSGALYRAAALAAQRLGLLGPTLDAAALAQMAASLPLRFDAGRVWMAGDDVTERLRDESVGVGASRVSALPQVREALHERQLAFRRAPGLVADGRDMGTVVFPGANLKVFLTASAAQRAERRHKQLISKGIPTNIDSLREDLEARDARDMNRPVAPLKPAQDALLLDNSALTIEASLDWVLERWEERRPFK
jgi:3-phosphoshikimate 1-carboxyvinyltransferase